MALDSLILESARQVQKPLKNLKLISTYLIERNNFPMKSDCYPYLILNSHGSTTGTSFFNCLKQIQSFISKNKKEFIIIRIRSGKNKIQNFVKLILMRYLKKCFQEKMINAEDMNEWFSIENVTMKNIWDHQKNILIYFDEFFFEDFQMKIKDNNKPDKDTMTNFLLENGMFNKDDVCEEHNFHKTTSKDLIDKMNSSFTSINKEKFRVSYFIFAPEKNFRLSYFFKIPTIYKLENENFLKGNKIMSYIIECIHHSKDINIGKFLN